MTNESFTSYTGTVSFGSRLKAAREAANMGYQDVGAQLRLNEKFIIMMEEENYPIDLPTAFIRGYLRSYARLLKIPEAEINTAIEPFKQQSQFFSNPLPPVAETTLTSSHYFMQIFTWLIVFTIIGLVGIWWYSRQDNVVLVRPQPIEKHMTNNMLENNPHPMQQDSTQTAAIALANTTPTPTPSTTEIKNDNINKTIEDTPKDTDQQKAASQADSDEDDDSETADQH
ncbi:MAG TPA: helix-turn-helix domain-containing protein [Gammaproteobacteria bacterium]|jgi:cytoskeleton protein RodZ|nr:helix-turn-helix domain-containing protein [Gammaproteobacteria bacterium]